MNIKKGNLITAIRCLRNRSKSVAYWSAFALFEIKNTQRHFYPCVWYFKQKLNMKLYRSDALLLSEPFCSNKDISIPVYVFQAKAQYEIVPFRRTSPV